MSVSSSKRGVRVSAQRSAHACETHNLESSCWAPESTQLSARLVKPNILQESYIVDFPTAQDKVLLLRAPGIPSTSILWLSMGVYSRTGYVPMLETENERSSATRVSQEMVLQSFLSTAKLAPWMPIFSCHRPYTDVHQEY